MKKGLSGPLLTLMLACGAWISMPSVSSAATITATVNGGVLNSGDPLKHFQAVFVFNTSSGYFDCTSGKCTDLGGGNEYGFSNPLTSATLSIGGGLYHSYSGVYYTEIKEPPDGTIGIVVQDDQDVKLTFSIYPAVVIARDLLSSFPLTSVLSTSSGSFCGADGCPASESGNLKVTSVMTEVSIPTSATPLPGALPLFAAGLLGLAAAAMRNRRKRSALPSGLAGVA